MTMSSPLVPTGPSIPFGSLVCTSVDDPAKLFALVRVTTNSQVSPGCVTIHVPVKSLGPLLVAAPGCASPLPFDSVIVPVDELPLVGELFAAFLAQATQANSIKTIASFFIWFSRFTASKSSKHWQELIQERSAKRQCLK